MRPGGSRADSCSCDLELRMKVRIMEVNDFKFALNLANFGELFPFSKRVASSVQRLSTESKSSAIASKSDWFLLIPESRSSTPKTNSSRKTEPRPERSKVRKISMTAKEDSLSASMDR